MQIYTDPLYALRIFYMENQRWQEEERDRKQETGLQRHTEQIYIP